MSYYQEYLNYENKIEKLEEDGLSEEANRIEDLQIKMRNTLFTKEDWLQLIKDAGSGRARYEYTRMMNERFPETKDEK